MKKISYALLLTCACTLLPGCSTHSIWIPVDTVKTQARPGQFAAHRKQVLLTDVPLPASIKYVSLGKIDAGKVTTCTTEDLLILMADRCRKIGADAVINLKTWRQPSGWTWDGPHGSGEAIKVSDADSLVGLTGYWY